MGLHYSLACPSYQLNFVYIVFYDTTAVQVLQLINCNKAVGLLTKTKSKDFGPRHDQLVTLQFLSQLRYYITSQLDGVGSGKGQVAGTCEYGEEPSGSKNAGNFLTSCRTS